MFSRSRVISSSAPKGSSISRSAGREGERARDRDALLHPARQLPGMVVLEAGQLDELEHLVDALGAAASFPAEHLERQRDVLLHRAPVVEHGRLEDDPVVAVEPGRRAGLPLTVTSPDGRLDDVADDAEQRRLAAARRADQRDELALADVEVDALERGHAASLEHLREAADGDDRLLGHTRCSGARRTTSFSTTDDGEEERDAEQRGDEVRRPEVLRARASSTG